MDPETLTKSLQNCIQTKKLAIRIPSHPTPKNEPDGNIDLQGSVGLENSFMDSMMSQKNVNKTFVNMRYQTSMDSRHKSKSGVSVDFNMNALLYGSNKTPKCMSSLGKSGTSNMSTQQVTVSYANNKKGPRLKTKVPTVTYEKIHRTGRNKSAHPSPRQPQKPGPINVQLASPMSETLDFQKPSFY